MFNFICESFFVDQTPLKILLESTNQGVAIPRYLTSKNKQNYICIGTIDDPNRKIKWQQIQGEIAQEYDVIKNIMQTLNLFKGGHYDSQVC